MSLIHPEASTCVLGELDLHALPITQKDILRSQTVVKTTNNALTDTTSSFDFTFEPTNLYTALRDTLLYLEFNVVQDDGTALAETHPACTVNNILHSLFSSVQLLINGEKVTPNYDEYAYKAYLLDLLGEEHRDKKTRLQGCSKWWKDEAGHMDARGDDNPGWDSRREDLADHTLHAVVGRPHIDLLEQCKLLPAHCELKFVFERHDKSFYMNMAAAQTFKVVIKKAEMSVRQIQVRDEVVEVHNKTVLNPKFGPFNYPIDRSKVTKHTLTQGSQEYSWTLTDTSQIPTRIIFGLVKETASAGDQTVNPFNFKHYDLREAVVKFDDQKFDLKTNFTTGNVTKAYYQLFKDSGILSCGLDCGITLEEFRDGYTLLAFDLTPDMTPEDPRINLLRQGKVTVSLKFGTVLPHAVSVIMLSFYNNLIQLTADRLPVTDYSMV